MKKWCLILVLSLNCIINFSQSIITDTVYVPFIPDSIIPSDFVLSGVTDKRGVNPKLVSYSQIKKYILIPVDQELCTEKPLAYHIKSSFFSSERPLDTFCMDINYFIIERINGRLFSPYLLKADLPLFQIMNGDTIHAGTLIYNYNYRSVKKQKDKAVVCQDMLAKWDVQLKLDMLQIANHLNSDAPPPDVFVKRSLKSPHFLNSSLGGVVGLNFYQIEGEIYFTRPETSNKQIFLANIIRYQHTSDFEMIGFGKKSEHFYKRLNEGLALDVSTNFLLGLLKWKANEEIKLYQLFQFSVSSTQSICFDKLNNRGWLLKTGLFENVYYTIDMTPKFQAGIYFSLGYKF